MYSSSNDPNQDMDSVWRDRRTGGAIGIICLAQDFRKVGLGLTSNHPAEYTQVDSDFWKEWLCNVAKKWVSRC